MQTLTLGKSVGTNFYVENVRSTGHIQGVARLFGEAIAYTDTKGVHLVEFPGKSATGLAAWVRREGNGTVRQTIGVQAPFDHFGGLQAVNGILLVAPMMGNGKASLALYQYSRMVGLEQIASWETSSLSGNAHYAGIVDGAGGRFFLAVGNDDRAEHAPHIVYLYAAEKLDGASPLEHIATWDRGIVNDDYQGISLIKECDSGELYLLGMGARGPGGRVMRRNYIELQHFRGYDPRNRVVDRLKINERNFQAEANDCDPDGGSSFHVTAEGQLVFYCAEKKVKGSEFTVREYR